MIHLLMVLLLHQLIRELVIDLSGEWSSEQNKLGLLNRRKEMRRQTYGTKDLYTYNPQEDGKFDIYMMLNPYLS